MSARISLLVACLVGLAVASLVGGSWSDRLSSHEGFYLVPVRDEVKPETRVALSARLPRRTVMVVVDGLGFEEASGMPALGALRARGQCTRTHVGSFPVSQPVYVVLSTGLEPDRTGARNNQPPLSALRAESLWSVAQQAGLTVSGISEMNWWQRLFPSSAGGFQTYLIRPPEENLFALAPPADLTLIHPLYVDEAGHSWGAASEPYRQAVARVDREIAGFAASLDLSRDLLVVTADHGHLLTGGHGAHYPARVTNVLTCYAGPGVRRSPELGQQDATSVAPALAVLLGLRFPAHMRAGLHGGEPDDDLDAVWRIADAAAFPPEYVADRLQAVQRFREENRSQLLRWPGGQSSWRGFYEQHRKAQQLRELGLLLVALAVLGVFARHPTRLRASVAGDRRRQLLRDGLLCVLWVAGIYLLLVLLTVLLRGSFDANAVNQREPFIRFGLLLSAAVLVGAGLVHLGLRRDLAALRADVLALLVVSITLNLGHPAVVGWRCGFPIPPSVFIFFPYFAALFLTVLSVLALPLCIDWPRSLRRHAAT
jgi:hypothetical protein